LPFIRKGAEIQTRPQETSPGAADATSAIDAKALKTLVPAKAISTLPIMAE
jgi:hypothetical protein